MLPPGRGLQGFSLPSLLLTSDNDFLRDSNFIVIFMKKIKDVYIKAIGVLRNVMNTQRFYLILSYFLRNYHSQ